MRRGHFCSQANGLSEFQRQHHQFDDHVPTRSREANQTIATGGNPASIQNSGATVVKRMTFREAASVIASPESGVITVRATARQHEKVQEFIDRVMRSAKRQVLIEATIIEVNLADNYQQGIDWTKAATQTGFSLSRASNTQNVTAATTPFSLIYKNIPGGLNVVVDMLRGFGTTKVLSSPKLTVLNKRRRRSRSRKTSSTFNVKQGCRRRQHQRNVKHHLNHNDPTPVSIGFFMSLTAQISDNGTVTLNVRPSISKVFDLEEGPESGADH